MGSKSQHGREKMQVNYSGGKPGQNTSTSGQRVRFHCQVSTTPGHFQGAAACEEGSWVLRGISVVRTKSISRRKERDA